MWLRFGYSPAVTEAHPLTGKTGRTLFVMMGALALPYANPALGSLRVVPLPWERNSSDDDSASVAAATMAPPAQGEQALPPSENTPTLNNALPSVAPATSAAPGSADNAETSAIVLPDVDPDVRATLRTTAIEDPSGHALDAFFERLARTEGKQAGAVTRILHYGDSTIASDYISGTARRRLQARFGDAGHGFILIANPWEWYFHNDVLHASDGEWKASRLAGPIAPDGLYGLGGVSFSSYGGGVAWFGTAPRGDFGRRASRFDLYYLEQPDGGDVELSVRGGAPVRFSTRGERKVSRIRSVPVDDGEAKLAVRAVGRGPVRLFGVALERDRPGVVYDALGSHAAMAVYWQRQDRAHWRDQIALRDPSLIVFQYGTNESDLWKLDRDAYARALGELIDELRDVAGGASLLVVSPLDRAERKSGTLATKSVILDLVAIQKREALARGVAFWNTFDAMGGEGAMARWSRAKPQLGGEDLTHPTPLGAEVIGDMLSGALVEAFDAWRARKAH
jgi:lysophospholipase L1-like esterase